MPDDQRDGETREDADRAAILARRRRFVLMALGGLTGVGCEQARPPASPPESFDTPAFDEQTAYESASASRSDVEPVPISDEELHAILQDPKLDPCVDPFAEDRGVELSQEQSFEVAKALFERAKAAQAEGDLACALALFEQAYFKVPGKHGFAFIVGELAWAVGECEKARSYLEHFVLYVDPERHAERHQRAMDLLDTPELRACERPPLDDGPALEPCLVVDRPRPSPPPPETKKQRRQRERAEQKTERRQQRTRKRLRR